jgi:hypothetical protein
VEQREESLQEQVKSPLTLLNRLSEGLQPSRDLLSRVSEPKRGPRPKLLRNEGLLSEFRSGKVTKVQAITGIAAAIPGVFDEGSPGRSAFEVYVQKLDEHDRFTREAGSRGNVTEKNPIATELPDFLETSYSYVHRITSLHIVALMGFYRSLSESRIRKATRSCSSLDQACDMQVLMLSINSGEDLNRIPSRPHRRYTRSVTSSVSLTDTLTFCL